MPLDLPTTLGPYLLEARLGEGGMAEVFRARAFGASGFEKIVAIKTLRPELIGESQYERMFIEEARHQARIDHSNLVQAHELQVADGRLFVRLEYVDGLDLATLQVRRPLTPGLAMTVITELAKGLHALHSATDEAARPLGLVHRDVSPGNVLISRHGEVKLADFGIAKATLLRETTRAGVRKGTHAYMSPEQIAGRQLTAASDQFALGVVLHEILHGPAPSDTAITPPSLARLLQKEPSARFATMREVFEAFMPEAASPFELSAHLVGALSDFQRNEYLSPT